MANVAVDLGVGELHEAYVAAGEVPLGVEGPRAHGWPEAGCERWRGRSLGQRSHSELVKMVEDNGHDPP